MEPFHKQIFLATKLHFRGEIPKNSARLEAVVRQHLQQSLQNLHSDYVDLYYLHRVNEQAPLPEVTAIMGKLIQERA